MSNVTVLRVTARALVLVAVFAALPVLAAGNYHPNDPGIVEPVTTHLLGEVVRMPNTDQSVDGVGQNNARDVHIEPALGATSLLGHPVTRVTSPNDDMREALGDMAAAAAAGEQQTMRLAAKTLWDILFGTTEGRIYDGFAMLNFNRWKEPNIVGPEHFPADAVPGEYKMKEARRMVDENGDPVTATSPYDGEQRAVWEVDINMLYYDGQIDSDTFLLKFPFGHHEDDTLHVNYRIYSLVREDFSPTVVMLDRRWAQDTVNFPFKGMDAVWVAMEPGDVLNVTVPYTAIRQVRGVYTWGWRQHPPRIQFLQPVYEIENVQTGEIELDAQGRSFAVRNRDNLTLDAISESAPEMKMLRAAVAALLGATPELVNDWLTLRDAGPAGTWVEWCDLTKLQTQLPQEAWDVLAEEDGLTPGEFGDYDMVTVYMNNEMYGEGPGLNEVRKWEQGSRLKAKLINLDRHTHYFRNVDFSARLHDDILNCCGGGFTSFEIMNFKPSYGAPKVAEMQYRAGWGFRPHHDVIQQHEVFPRPRDRVGLKPYFSGLDEIYFGYQYSAEARDGDFRFNPPPFIITDHDNPAPFRLRDIDGLDGLVIGQHTPGYGNAQMCPDDPAGDFCQTDFGPANPFGVLNWPSPNDPTVEKTELRFPAFLRNPDQGASNAGDIIPPTGAWRPFLWVNPYTNSLYIDPDDPSKGYWSDLTYSHGAPVYAGTSIVADIEAPRSSGQLFYQFDDLFHDNSIFSPHPLTTGPGDEGDETDEIAGAAAWLGNPGTYQVRGSVAHFRVNGEYSKYLQLYDGPAGEYGCSGKVVRAAPVNEDGRFLFWVLDNLASAGDTVCVESLLGGYREIVLQRNPGE